jgi:hypothetical protein
VGTALVAAAPATSDASAGRPRRLVTSSASDVPITTSPMNASDVSVSVCPTSRAITDRTASLRENE